MNHFKKIYFKWELSNNHEKHTYSCNPPGVFQGGFTQSSRKEDTK